MVFLSVRQSHARRHHRQDPANHLPNLHTSRPAETRTNLRPHLCQKKKAVGILSLRTRFGVKCVNYLILSAAKTPAGYAPWNLTRYILWMFPPHLLAPRILLPAKRLYIRPWHSEFKLLKKSPDPSFFSFHLTHLHRPSVNCIHTNRTTCTPN